MASGYRRTSLPAGASLHRSHAHDCPVRTKPNQGQCTVFLDVSVIEEIATEAKQRERSLSWIMQRAWRLARSKVRALPTPTSS